MVDDEPCCSGIYPLCAPLLLWILPPFSSAMSSALESEAALKAKMTEKNLMFIWNRMVEKGWKTMAQFAYATSYVPGNADDTALRNDIFKVLIKPDDPEPAGLEAHLRRLFFESHTLAVYETRAMVDKSLQPEGPRKLDAYEREERRRAFLARNQRGAHYWSDDRIASDDLIDLCVEMYEDKEIRYIPWDQRTNQRFMLDHAPRSSKQKPDPDFAFDSRGYLKKCVQERRPTSNIHEGMADFTFLWERMMDRFGMALEIAHIMTYNTHEVITNFLLERKRRAPNSPEFMPVEWDQVLKAEKELWRLLREDLKKDVRGQIGQPPPADAKVEGILKSWDMFQILCNAKKVTTGGGNPKRQAEEGVKRTAEEVDQDTANSKTAKRRRRNKNKREKEDDANKKAAAAAQAQRAAALAAAAAKTAGAGGGGGRPTPKNPKGKGKGKVPAALVGHESYCTLSGKEGRICWDYSLTSCNKAKPGEQCPKGWHVCAAKGCGFKNHPFHECHLGGKKL